MVGYVLILRLVWHKPKVRLGYGYFVAALNVFAIAMYTLSSLSGQMSRLDAFAFGFLHAMVSVVMLTLIHKEVNLEKQRILTIENVNTRIVYSNELTCKLVWLLK